MAARLHVQHALYDGRLIAPGQLDAYKATGWEEVGQVADPIVDGTVDEVLAKIERGELNPQAALAAEMAKEHPRKGLVTPLARLADTTTASDTEES